MTTIPGVDYSSGHPGGAALAAAGKAFAARYVSTQGNPKNISLAEATDLAAHGVWSVVVWETTANRAGAGRAAGIADAHDAVAQATAAGLPPGRPIYFAVDWDADPLVVVPYFQGVASVLGLPRTGVYGGYRVVRYLLDHGLAHWAWQTAAWSQGKQDTRAAIYQDATGTHINGIACDNDIATAADYGQWMPGKTPLVEDPMTPADAKLAADTLLATTITSRFRKDAKGQPAKISVGTHLDALDGHYDATMKAVADLDAVVKAQAVPALTDAQVTAIGAQVAASPALAQAIATAVVNLEAQRLQS